MTTECAQEIRKLLNQTHTGQGCVWLETRNFFAGNLGYDHGRTTKARFYPDKQEIKDTYTGAIQLNSCPLREFTLLSCLSDIDMQAKPKTLQVKTVYGQCVPHTVGYVHVSLSPWKMWAYAKAINMIYMFKPGSFDDLWV